MKDMIKETKIGPLDLFYQKENVFLIIVISLNLFIKDNCTVNIDKLRAKPIDTQFKYKILPWIDIYFVGVFENPANDICFSIWL